MNLLPVEFFPRHEENRMNQEGDVAAAREAFFKREKKALERLLFNRYHWMNPYLEGKTQIIEIGSGAGFSKEFIKHPHLLLTDVNAHPWIDLKVDALNPPFTENSLEAIIATHMIHHLAHPRQFFKIVDHVLKPGGVLLLHEIQTSFLMKVLLRLMRHEGWSYNVDVFNEKAVANHPDDPWSANCAIPDLLFSDSKKFEKEFPQFTVEKNELCEFLLFPLSGGVISKVKTPNIPDWGLDLVEKFDELMVRLFPKLCAFGRKVVLRKKEI